jgi:hypothetical protein
VSVLPVADGRGACSGISMWSVLSLMVVFIGLEFVSFQCSVFRGKQGEVIGFDPFDRLEE